MAQDDLEFDEIYNEFLNVTGDPTTATQYAAYQYIVNPTGSIKQLKTPEQWYSDEEWFNYTAPNYLAIRDYAAPEGQLEDPLTKYISNIFKDEKQLKERGLSYISEKTRGQEAIEIASAAGIDLDTLYSRTKDIYDEYQSAQQNIKRQASTHPFVQYGLPNPNDRFYYGKQELKDGKPVNNQVYQLPAEISGAIDLAISTQSKNLRTKLKGQGFTTSQIAAAEIEYETYLRDKYNKQLANSRITPFTVAAIQRARLGRKG